MVIPYITGDIFKDRKTQRYFVLTEILRYGVCLVRPNNDGTLSTDQRYLYIISIDKFYGMVKEYFDYVKNMDED